LKQWPPLTAGKLRALLSGVPNDVPVRVNLTDDPALLATLYKVECSGGLCVLYALPAPEHPALRHLFPPPTTAPNA
jgi:hypothetical protein